MKAFVVIILLLCTGAVLCASPPGTDPVVGTMRLYVDNVREAQGTIWIGVYTSPEDFLDREKARLVAVKISSTGRAYVDIPGMVVGKEYALGLFHDVNDNGELDLNWLGLPAEPWAFSGQPKTRLRLPHFHEVSFDFSLGEKRKTVRLRKW